MQATRSIEGARTLVAQFDAEKVTISKSELPELPDRFSEYYPANGMQNDGATASYRDGREHIIEYGDHWKYHIDEVDPEEEPINHALQDAPMTVGLVCLLVLNWYLHR